VHSFLIPLLKGLTAVFAIAGVGKLLLRLVGIRELTWSWRIAFALLAGQVAVFVLVEAVLLSGAGSAAALRVLVWMLAGAGVVGHVFFSQTGAANAIGEIFRGDKIITAVLLLAVFANLIAALAPSTKIDELFYHMLTSKRIVEDGGLRFYMLPIESAIAPQMHYQIALSLAHASGAPDAGNVLSWGYSAALSLFIIGFLTDATKNHRLSLLCGAVCSVGIYATVWHTTGGAHALGDFATVVALAGVLRPAILIDALGAYRYTFLLSTAAALAGSTKISLVPLSLVVSLLIVAVGIRGKNANAKTFNVIALALLPWVVLHLPLMIWTYVLSGSFWGPVLANVFGHSAVPAGILQSIRELQAFVPGSLVSAAKYAAIGFSPVFFISVAWILWAALRGDKISRLVAALFLFQGALVAWKFHFDVRFLGGMEYVVVLATVLTFAGSQTTERFSSKWAPIGLHLTNSRRWIILLAAIPWLAFQMYYAKPFAEVVSGFTPRSQFLERYVALTHDFEQLDRILPRDAVLYITGERWPNFYAPRPVVLTLLDLRGHSSIFRLTPSPEEDAGGIDDIALSLKCGDVVYQNDHAVIETYRTPGELPFIGAIKVQRCELRPAGAEH
jgi:hypothetical protein